MDDARSPVGKVASTLARLSLAGLPVSRLNGVPIGGRQAGSYVAGDVVGEVAEPGRRTGYSSAQISPYEHGLAPLNDLAMLRLPQASSDFSEGNRLLRTAR